MDSYCPVACLLVILTAGLCWGEVQHLQASLIGGSDVITLSDSNFATRLADVDLALVKFHSPGCSHCQQLAPEFAEAASQLKFNSPPVTLAEVDCKGDGKAICAENDIEHYPVMKVFKRGKAAFDYEGPRQSGAIVSFLRSKLGPSSIELQSIDDVDRFLSYTELIIIGFFEAAEATEMNKTFHELADFFSNRIRFGHTFNAAICDKYSYKNAFVLFREPRFQSKMEPSQIQFSGDATLSNLKTWVTANIYSLVGHRTLRNTDEFKNPLVVVHYDVDYLRNAKGTNYWRNRIVKVAKRFADEGRNVSFAISNANELNELGSFGLKKDRLPAVTAWDATERKYRMTEEFTTENLEAFVESFLDGKIKPYLKSEPIPETNDGPVKVVVAETFKEIVNDETKDVLIEMYSPMCGHCMVLAPKYEKLAIKLKDETDLVIAKIDATANEVPDIYDIPGFPAIYFLPKGAKDKPVMYTGDREVDAFVQFLAKESTSPLKGFDRKGRPVKTKKKKATTDEDKEL